MHNIISKLKNDKPWKNEIVKESSRPPLRRPAPAPYFYPFFNFSDSPLPLPLKIERVVRIMHYNATFFQMYQFLEQVAVEIHSAITSLYKRSLFSQFHINIQRIEIKFFQGCKNFRLILSIARYTKNLFLYLSSHIWKFLRWLLHFSVCMSCLLPGGHPVIFLACMSCLLPGGHPVIFLAWMSCLISGGHPVIFLACCWILITDSNTSVIW